MTELWNGTSCDARTAASHLADAAKNSLANTPEISAAARVRIQFLTPGAFSPLGVRGRVFTPEDAVPGNRFLMISDGLWQRRFGGDPGVIERTIRVGDDPGPIVRFCLFGNSLFKECGVTWDRSGEPDFR